LLSPFFLLDGFKDVVLGGEAVSIRPGSLGPLYVVVTLALLGTALLTLFTRYRKVAA
jgi:hypothetical protein